MSRLAITLILCCLAVAGSAQAQPNIEHVIIVVMENKDAFSNASPSDTYVYGNVAQAPYINQQLAPKASRSLKFIDELPEQRSEPHYILMEAGTNVFKDTTFQCDADPLKPCNGSSTNNWTASSRHLVTQLAAAGLTWKAYVQGLDPPNTGRCPVTSSGLYAAKHVPFVFFSDVAGQPPSPDNAACAAHFGNFRQFANDLASGSLPNYVFIVPDLCKDMHGAPPCEDKNPVKVGDNFLSRFLPDVLSWARDNKAIVLVAWDEGHDSNKIPFYMAGAGVKKGYSNAIRYSHRSILKTVEIIFGLPILGPVKDAPDLSDMFTAGSYP